SPHNEQTSSNTDTTGHTSEAHSPVPSFPPHIDNGDPTTSAVLGMLQIRQPLLSVQFGVGSLGDVEPILLGVRSVIKLESESSCFSNHIGSQSQRPESGNVAIDFTNAFNSVSRRQIAVEVRRRMPGLFSLVKFLYSKPSPLLVLVCNVEEPPTVP